MNAKESFTPDVRAESPVAGPEQKEIWGSDAIAAMLRALDIPYLALNPGASYRGLHDDLQRLVRPHAGADPWCDRAVGRRQAASLDRLDPYGVRSGRARARLHQVGQPARVCAGGVRGALTRRADRQHRAARPDLCQPRRGAAGSEDRRAPLASGREAPSRARSGAAGRALGRGRGEAPIRREAPGDPRRACLEKRIGLEAAGRARGEAAGAGLDRHQARGCVSDRSSAARRAAGDISFARHGEAAARGGRGARARLDRSRRGAQAGLGR